MTWVYHVSSDETLLLHRERKKERAKKSIPLSLYYKFDYTLEGSSSQSWLLDGNLGKMVQMHPDEHIHMDDIWSEHIFTAKPLQILSLPV